MNEYEEPALLDSQNQQLLNQNGKPPKTPILDGIAMVFLGLLNNLFFLIVMSSAQRIVDHFEAEGLLAIVNWACTFCGLFANFLNSFLTTYNVSYDIRFICNSICMGIGLLGSSFAPNFWLACLSILFIGFSCNFGESVALGYLAYIKKQHYVKFWGIGTGTAGILGSGFSTLCITFTFKYNLSFLVLFPLVGIYFCSYFFILRKSHKRSEIALLTENNEPSSSALTDAADETAHESTLKKWCNLQYIKKLMYYILTCDIVYFAQYVIASAFLDCAQTQEVYHSSKYLFPLLSLTQHIGVLIFASSLNWFHVPYLASLATIQMINFFIWLSQAMLHWMPIWSEFIFIFLVGCCGGVSYVNTYDMVMNDEKLDHKERELGSNIIAFSVTIAVVFSSLFSLLSEKTYLAPFVPKPDTNTTLSF